MTRHFLLFLLTSILLCSCQTKDVRTNELTVDKIASRNFKRVNTLNEIINHLNNNDTLVYSDIDDILKLNLFLKEKLPSYIVVSDSNNTYSRNENYKSLRFALMDSITLFNKAWYDLNIELIDNRIQLLSLFNHEALKYEIRFVESYKTYELMGVKDADKINSSADIKNSFVKPGDSTRTKW